MIPRHLGGATLDLVHAVARPTFTTSSRFIPAVKNSITNAPGVKKIDPSEHGDVYSPADRFAYTARNARRSRLKSRAPAPTPIVEPFLFFADDIADRSFRLGRSTTFTAADGEGMILATEDAFPGVVREESRVKTPEGSPAEGNSSEKEAKDAPAKKEKKKGGCENCPNACARKFKLREHILRATVPMPEAG